MAIIVVTGINDKYFKIFLKFFEIYLSNGNDPNNFILYDLGIENDYNKQLIESIKKKYGIIFKSFDYSGYQDHIDLRKYQGEQCTYAWKPVIIYNECIAHPDDYVIWSDVRTLFQANTLISVKNIIDKEGAWIMISNARNTENVHRYMYKKVLEYFDIPDDISKHTIDMKWAGTCGFKYSDPISKYIVDEWYKYALIKEAICPDGSDRSNHRQDQSLLSIIIYKKGLQDKFSNNNCGVRGWTINIW
jgi:hypothetical protein